MRIIGGHDYYDGGMAFGQDRDLVFVRDGKTVEDKDCPFVLHYPHDFVREKNRRYYGYRDGHDIYSKNADYNLSSAVVWVAGKRYGGIRVTQTKTGLYDPLEKTDEVFWEYNKFVAFVEQFDYKIHVPSKWDLEYRGGNAFAKLEDWFVTRDANKEEMDWIVEHRAAIAIPYLDPQRRVHNGNVIRHWHINPATQEHSLKQMDFQKVMDPYTIFQELSMFVGGVLPRNPNPIVEITDDKIKIHKHGFNHPLSFRKQKAVK